MVERFKQVRDGRLGWGLARRSNGDLCRHSDYEALERQLAEARAERVTLEERLATAYQAKYRCNEDANFERRLRLAAEAERDRLTADNARLREALPATGPYVDRIVRIFRDKSDDDTSAVVLQDYARAALAGKE